MQIYIASDTDYGVPFILDYDDREFSYFQAMADAKEYTGREWRIANDIDIEINKVFDDIYYQIEDITDNSDIAWDGALAYVNAEFSIRRSNIKEAMREL